MKLRTLTKKNVSERNIFGRPVEAQHRTYIYKWTLTGRKYLAIIKVVLYDGETFFGKGVVLHKNIEKVYCTFVSNINVATYYNPQETNFLMKDIPLHPNKYILK